MIGLTVVHIVGKQLTPINERRDAGLISSRELQRMQGKGWELPKFPPLTWNASRFERAAECPQHSEKKGVSGLGRLPVLS
jgi:hypothetical protein